MDCLGRILLRRIGARHGCSGYCRSSAGCDFSSGPRELGGHQHRARAGCRQLEYAGVIRGYTAIVDPVQVGLKVQAFVQVKLKRHTAERIGGFQRELPAIREIISCYAISGAHDLMLQIVAPDLDALTGVAPKTL